MNSYNIEKAKSLLSTCVHFFSRTYFRIFEDDPFFQRWSSTNVSCDIKYAKFSTRDGWRGTDWTQRCGEIVENRVSIHFTFPPFFRTRVRERQISIRVKTKIDIARFFLDFFFFLLREESVQNLEKKKFCPVVRVLINFTEPRHREPRKMTQFFLNSVKAKWSVNLTV